MRNLGSCPRLGPARFPALLALLLSLNVLALAALGGMAGTIVEIPVAVATILLVAAYLNERRP